MENIEILNGHATDDARARTKRPGILSLLVTVSVLGVSLTLLAAALGYGLASKIDSRRAAESRTALVAGMQEFRALFGHSRELDPRFVRMLEQNAGLADLQFAAEPPLEARETQPVTDEAGRIVGFFSWQGAHVMRASLNRLMPVNALAAFLFAGLISIPLWQSRRARFALAEIERERARSRAMPGVAPGEAASRVPSQRPSLEEELIERELPRALAAQTLDLHYQPIVAATGARVVGVEALLRWCHAGRGMISPAQFIPVAERIGIMDKLGEFVLKRALEDSKRWPDLYVAVNLSPLQLRDRRIVDFVRAAVRQSGIEPKRLMLEVTEGVLVDNPEEMKRRLDDLRALGVRIALDDFGSGYCNLSYLHRFPFDKLKIDQGFVAALGKTGNSGVIVQAMVTLGRALGASVLAEGVETEEQRVLLRMAGCDELQGFLFAKPGPRAAIDRLLAQALAAKARTAAARRAA